MWYRGEVLWSIETHVHHLLAHVCHVVGFLHARRGELPVVGVDSVEVLGVGGIHGVARRIIVLTRWRVLRIHHLVLSRPTAYVRIYNEITQ